MDIIDWIRLNRSGEIVEFTDRLEIEHDCGEHSTIWLNKSLDAESNGLDHLGGFFEKYDGADLFSSTFKIASAHEGKMLNNVKMTFSLEEINDELKSLKTTLPSGVTAFMIQLGIGIYSINESRDKVYEWDFELVELSDTYSSLFDILDEWKEAVS